MLFRLLLFRMGPLIVLCFLKDRRKLKLVVYGGMICWIVFFVIAVASIFQQEGWKGVIFLLLSMFPHYIFYGLACWMIVRCIRSAWSSRVWRRICCVAFVCVICGIYLEMYINPLILNFFVKKI